MKKNHAISSLFIFTICGLFILYTSVYRSLFRFDEKTLKDYLKLQNSVVCTSFSGCNLQPGDILIRRYMTDHTRMITNLTNVYFNHTAFYMGSGMIFEAVGSEKNPYDDIIIHPLRDTDWMDREVEQLFVIRPKYTISQLSKIQKDLEQIAQDPEYIFGVSFFGEKKTYCSVAIYRELIGVGIINDPYGEKLITPDRLVLEIGL